MVDEADEANFGQQTPTKKRQQQESPPSSPGPRKRKPGKSILKAKLRGKHCSHEIVFRSSRDHRVKKVIIY